MVPVSVSKLRDDHQAPGRVSPESVLGFSPNPSSLPKEVGSSHPPILSKSGGHSQYGTFTWLGSAVREAELPSSTLQWGEKKSEAQTASICG